MQTEDHADAKALHKGNLLHRRGKGWDLTEKCANKKSLESRYSELSASGAEYL